MSLAFGERSSDEENVEADDGRRDNTKEPLGDNDGEVQQEIEDHTFRPVWKDVAGGYLRGVRGYSSSTTKKRERKRQRDLEKSASTTKSIVDTFSTHSNKYRPSNQDLLLSPPPADILPKILKRKGEKPALNPKLEPLII